MQVFTVKQATGKGITIPKCYKNATAPSPAGTRQPPRPLVVAVPLKSGVYPVVHLQHGFLMSNSFYTQLLQHVTSHGYIVIAPQMPQQITLGGIQEIAMAAATLDWYPNNLAAKIEERVPDLRIIPDLNKVILAGHSRGGKVAFGLATGFCKTCLQFSGIAGLDPVDGKGPGQQSEPPILPNKQHGLNLTFPTLVVGAGLGGSCAPLGVSHEAFFYNSGPLAFHYVAPDYGHMDYLNDKLSGLDGIIANMLCQNGPSRVPMRQFTGGILVAFLDAVLFGNTDAMSRALHNVPSEAPLLLQPPEITGDFPLRLQDSL